MSNSVEVLPALNKSVHIPRKSSKAFLIIAGMASTGLTLSDIQLITGWDKSTSKSAIREDVRKRAGLRVTLTGEVYRVNL